MKLYFHETHNLYGKYAVAKTAAILEQRHISYEQLAGSFHQASEKISKFLLFIVIPFLALVSWRLGFRNRKYYFDHFVFTIEAFSFFILWGFLLLPFIIAVYSLGFGNNLLNADNRIGLVIIFAFMIYLAIATKRFFGFKWWYSIIYTILFSAALIAFLEYIYKFILFFIAIRLAK